MRTELEALIREIDLDEMNSQTLIKCCVASATFVEAATAELARRAEFGVTRGDLVYVKIPAKVMEVRYATNAVVVRLDEDGDGEEGMLYTVCPSVITSFKEAETPVVI